MLGRELARIAAPMASPSSSRPAHSPAWRTNLVPSAMRRSGAA
jgi:hypothetical protein